MKQYLRADILLTQEVENMPGEGLTIAAIGALMDEKLKPIFAKLDQMDARLDQMDARLDQVEVRFDQVDEKLEEAEKRARSMGIILENEVRPQVRILAENYVPAAKRFVQAADGIESMKSDIKILQKVAEVHSKKLKNIS